MRVVADVAVEVGVTACKTERVFHRVAVMTRNVVPAPHVVVPAIGVLLPACIAQIVATAVAAIGNYLVAKGTIAVARLHRFAIAVNRCDDRVVERVVQQTLVRTARSARLPTGRARQHPRKQRLHSDRGPHLGTATRRCIRPSTIQLPATIGNCQPGKSSSVFRVISDRVEEALCCKVIIYIYVTYIDLMPLICYCNNKKLICSFKVRF
ncbi:hypothetical protein GKIL_3361 [Gloeobacter kilaueensis JS1]|uniref:Uncharacterized protein n=1 Tax=Gloeobacter kilaueensis (strain ATCC BAA-2537 / CCAP 1431/1 / ULC 316 / JS1) TaxID=1183438 RepID=U5QKU6_GLOK1|nr:hypothetical protein GKIL_3361 [Gloeobacter kilaueensis JS1]